MENKIRVRELPVIHLYDMDTENKEMYFKYKFCKEKYKGQDEVLEYMKSGVVYGAKAEVLHDVFSNASIPYESLVLTDGNYKWSTELMYYVEQYNLRVPNELIELALKDKKVHITQDDLC